MQPHSLRSDRATIRTTRQSGDVVCLRENCTFLIGRQTPLLMIIFIHKQALDMKQNIKYETKETRMWANDQPDGRPAERRWRPLFNAAKFG